MFYEWTGGRKMGIIDTIFDQATLVIGTLMFCLGVVLGVLVGFNF